MFFRILIIFFIAFVGVLIYLSFWAKIFSGDWLAISFINEMPLAIIVAFIAPMIYVSWKIFPAGRERKYFIYGFSMLIILILYVLAVDKYSFVFPYEKWIYILHPVEPIIFTILAMFLLKGTSKLI